MAERARVVEHPALAAEVVDEVARLAGKLGRIANRGGVARVAVYCAAMGIAEALKDDALKEARRPGVADALLRRAARNAVAAFAGKRRKARRRKPASAPKED